MENISTSINDAQNEATARHSPQLNTGSPPGNTNQPRPSNLLVLTPNLPCLVPINPYIICLQQMNLNNKWNPSLPPRSPHALLHNSSITQINEICRSYSLIVRITQHNIKHQLHGPEIIATVLMPTKVTTKTENIVIDVRSVTWPIRDLKLALMEAVTYVLVKAQHPIIHDAPVFPTLLTSSFKKIRQCRKANKTITKINNRPFWLTLSLSFKGTRFTRIRLFIVSSRNKSSSTEWFLIFITVYIWRLILVHTPIFLIFVRRYKI